LPSQRRAKSPPWPADVPVERLVRDVEAALPAVDEAPGLCPGVRRLAIVNMTQINYLRVKQLG
jgi:hypothetical protein